LFKVAGLMETNSLANLFGGLAIGCYGCCAGHPSQKGKDNKAAYRAGL
jgi:hypothetical protein